ncbi:MAG: NUDIX domain-containing protein [Bacteroidales bacterium]|nr:NUDIX domain-containing protein [Bacteroidales bacterium]
MNQVFFHEHLLTFDPDQFSGSLKVKVTDEAKLREFVYRWLQEERRKDALLYGYNVNQMKKDFRRMFQFVEAAGGVVRNKQHNVLFIKRWERWDLPKGKKEKKETLPECALREVEEETGVKKLHIVRALSSSYHIFETTDQWYLKKTYWFLMETGYEGETKPQNEEDITAVQWMNEQQCLGALSSTYRSLRAALKMEICELFEEKMSS